MNGPKYHISKVTLLINLLLSQDFFSFKNYKDRLKESRKGLLKFYSTLTKVLGLGAGMTTLISSEKHRTETSF